MPTAALGLRASMRKMRSPDALPTRLGAPTVEPTSRSPHPIVGRSSHASNGGDGGGCGRGGLDGGALCTGAGGGLDGGGSGGGIGGGRGGERGGGAPGGLDGDGRGGGKGGRLGDGSGGGGNGGRLGGGSGGGGRCGGLDGGCGGKLGGIAQLRPRSNWPSMLR
mmetsp:Transcript_11900/g.37721  ORF Transcript_11900/g.37721 Transcript_11900/m.37721 type:complete len:164 (-) Transcript_11900:39-530(-)